LVEYGSPSAAIKFWMRHNKIQDAIEFFLNKDLPKSQFITYVVLNCRNVEEIKNLQQTISNMDPNFSKFKEHLLSVCSYYNKKKELDHLLFWQIFMKDYARAGLTCIKLFVDSPTMELKTRLEYLNRSKEYFIKETEAADSGRSDDVLSVTELRKYLKKINVQREISTFFNEYRISVTQTVFGSIKQRCELTERVLELGNYDLGVLIILNFDLPVGQILTNVVNILVKNTELSQVKNLLRRGKDLLRKDDDWDNFVIVCVKTFVEIGESKMAEGFISFILRDEKKIDCLMWCGKLKTAYLLAVKTSQRDKVIKIRDEAKLKNFPTEYRLCVQYLEQNPEAGV